MFPTIGSKIGRRRRPAFGSYACQSANGQILFDASGSTAGTDNIVYVYGPSINNITHYPDYANSVPCTIQANATQSANTFQVGNATSVWFAVNSSSGVVGTTIRAVNIYTFQGVEGAI